MPCPVWLLVYFGNLKAMTKDSALSAARIWSLPSSFLTNQIRTLLGNHFCCERRDIAHHLFRTSPHLTNAGSGLQVILISRHHMEANRHI